MAIVAHISLPIIIFFFFTKDQGIPKTASISVFLKGKCLPADLEGSAVASYSTPTGKYLKLNQHIYCLTFISIRDKKAANER